MNTIEAHAPGRVNLIGEHTDYNGGWVLPVALPQRTRVKLWVDPKSQRAQIFSNSMSAEKELSYELGAETRQGKWIDYAQGVTRALRRAGFEFSGFRAEITSDVPLGAGLSSSASFEVALLRALRKAFDLSIDDTRIAKLGQEAENDFVGANTGIMDQMAASLAPTGAALFLDTQELVYETLPLPDSVEICVVSSGISHRNTSGGYAQRRKECEQGARIAQVRSLRDLKAPDLAQLELIPQMPLSTFKRVRHVVTENARVNGFVQAMRQSNLREMGSILNEGHCSLSQDFEVSLPEIDLLADLLRDQPGIVGARLTGGGFGGSVVALAQKGLGRHATAEAAQEYARQTGQTPRVLLPLSS